MILNYMLAPRVLCGLAINWPYRLPSAPSCGLTRSMALYPLRSVTFPITRASILWTEGPTYP